MFSLPGARTWRRTAAGAAGVATDKHSVVSRPTRSVRFAGRGRSRDGELATHSCARRYYLSWAKGAPMSRPSLFLCNTAMRRGQRHPRQ